MLDIFYCFHVSYFWQSNISKVSSLLSSFPVALQARRLPRMFWEKITDSPISGLSLSASFIQLLSLVFIHKWLVENQDCTNAELHLKENHILYIYLTSLNYKQINQHFFKKIKNYKILREKVCTTYPSYFWNLFRAAIVKFKSLIIISFLKYIVNTLKHFLR